jgi:chromosome segregation ATPase
LRNDIGGLILKILERNRTILNINLLFNRIQLKTIDEINQKLNINNEKEKSKYVPNLKRSIRELEFDPMEFQKYIQLIKDKKSQQITLAKKVKEDNLIYNKLLSKEENILEAKFKYLGKISVEIRNFDKKINQTERCIRSVEDNLNVNEKRIKKSIAEESHYLGMVDINNIKLKTEYDLIKKEFDDIINDTEKKLKESEERVLDKENDLNEIKENYFRLNKLYEKMNNPDMLVPIRPKELNLKRSTKKLKISRRGTLLDIKKMI